MKKYILSEHMYYLVIYIVLYYLATNTNYILFGYKYKLYIIINNFLLLLVLKILSIYYIFWFFKENNLWLIYPSHFQL